MYGRQSPLVLCPGVSPTFPLCLVLVWVGQSPSHMKQKGFGSSDSSKEGLFSQPYPQHLPAQLQPCGPAALSQSGGAAQTAKGVCDPVSDSPGNSVGKRASEVLGSAAGSGQVQPLGQTRLPRTLSRRGWESLRERIPTACLGSSWLCLTHPDGFPRSQFQGHLRSALERDVAARSVWR